MKVSFRLPWRLAFIVFFARRLGEAYYNAWQDVLHDDDSKEDSRP